MLFADKFGTVLHARGLDPHFKEVKLSAIKPNESLKSRSERTQHDYPPDVNLAAASSPFRVFPEPGGDSVI